MRKLDLGCGTAKVEGSIGLDRVPLVGVDIVANLHSIPYPFADNTFDEIYLNDVIEHLPDTIKAMEEIYRLAKPNAHVFIRVVNWNSHYAAMDPTHVRFFTEHSFDFFGKRPGRRYYSSAKFEVVSVEYQFNYVVQHYLRSKRFMKFLSNYLSNILEGLHFNLQAIKSPGQIEIPDQADFFSLLRCTHCLLHRKKAGLPDIPLRRRGSNWLICDDPHCHRKYPMRDGLPWIDDDVGQRWENVPEKDLPEPSAEMFQRVTEQV